MGTPDSCARHKTRTDHTRVSYANARHKDLERQPCWRPVVLERPRWYRPGIPHTLLPSLPYSRQVLPRCETRAVRVWSRRRRAWVRAMRRAPHGIAYAAPVRPFFALAAALAGLAFLPPAGGAPPPLPLRCAWSSKLPVPHLGGLPRMMLAEGDVIESASPWSLVPRGSASSSRRTS